MRFPLLIDLFPKLVLMLSGGLRGRLFGSLLQVGACLHRHRADEHGLRREASALPGSGQSSLKYRRCNVAAETLPERVADSDIIWWHLTG